MSIELLIGLVLGGLATAAAGIFGGFFSAGGKAIWSKVEERWLPADIAMPPGWVPAHYNSDDIRWVANEGKRIALEHDGWTYGRHHLRRRAKVYQVSGAQRLYLMVRPGASNIQ